MPKKAKAPAPVNPAEAILVRLESVVTFADCVNVGTNQVSAMFASIEQLVKSKHEPERAFNAIQHAMKIMYPNQNTRAVKCSNVIKVVYDTWGHYVPKSVPKRFPPMTQLAFNTIRLTEEEKKEREVQARAILEDKLRNPVQVQLSEITHLVESFKGFDANTWWDSIIYIQIMTGARIFETMAEQTVYTVKSKDLLSVKGVLKERKGKESKAIDRPVWWPHTTATKIKTTISALRAWKKREQSHRVDSSWFDQQVNQRIQVYFPDQPLEQRLTSHDLRGLYVALVLGEFFVPEDKRQYDDLQGGAQVMKIQDILGHDSVNSSLHYAKFIVHDDRGKGAKRPRMCGPAIKQAVQEALDEQKSKITACLSAL